MQAIFWKDSFEFLEQLIARLDEVIKHESIDKYDYMLDASIYRFKPVIELFWKVLKKALAYEKIDATTPRDVLSKAFQFKIIDDEAIWLKMLDDRNNASHVYKQEDAKRVFDNIKTYLPIFEKTYGNIKKQYEL